jgi:hypothetical protein
MTGGAVRSSPVYDRPCSPWSRRRGRPSFLRPARPAARRRSSPHRARTYPTRGDDRRASRTLGASITASSGRAWASDAWGTRRRAESGPSTGVTTTLAGIATTRHVDFLHAGPLNPPRSEGSAMKFPFAGESFFFETLRATGFAAAGVLIDTAVQEVSSPVWTPPCRPTCSSLRTRSGGASMRVLDPGPSRWEVP